MQEMTIPIKGELRIMLDIGNDVLPFTRPTGDENVLIRLAKSVPKYEKKRGKPRGRYKRLDEATKERIITIFREKRIPLKDIGKSVGVNSSTVRKALISAGFSTARATNWNEEDDKFLMSFFTKEPKATADTLKRTVKACSIRLHRINHNNK